MGFGRSRLDGQWGRHLEKEQIGDGEAQVEFGCAELDVLERESQLEGSDIQAGEGG